MSKDLDEVQSKVNRLISTVDRPILPVPVPPFAGHIGRTVASSVAAFPPLIRPPKGAPNVLLILLDDVGFGQPSTFGGPIGMPTLDKIASRGLCYNRFHTTAMCSPTRAALLTGRNHHMVANGAVAEMGTGFPGYNTMWPRSAGSIAEILRLNGYATSAFGKWHNTPEWEASPTGPFDHWPTGLGFEYFYGFLGADCDQWHPNLYENTLPVDPPATPEQGYHLDVDLADHAISWMRLNKSITPDRPFFMYYAPGSAHAPHHAPKSWIDKYRGMFDHGWDRQREITFERQRQLGMIPLNAQLTARPDEIPGWDELTTSGRRIAARMQEAFAGALSHCDEQIGRVVSAIDDMAELENTLVIFIAGDNGPAAEGTIRGQFNKWAVVNSLVEDEEVVANRIEEIGSPTSYNNYPVGWAWAGATPLRWFKQIASHFGGTRNGLVISWPQQITAANGLRTQFHHCVDIVPTILEAIGVSAPTIVNGAEQSDFAGVSMCYTFDGKDEPSRHRTQYFEIIGNRAIYNDGWIASARHGRLPWQYTGGSTGNFDKDQWELYNVDVDFSQADDISSVESVKLAALRDLWWAEAARNQVLPLDDRLGERLTVDNRPNPGVGRQRFVYYSGAIRIPEGSAPNLKGRSHKILAEINRREGDEGIIVSAGGRFAGYALFILKDRLHYVHNVCGTEYHEIISEPLPSGDMKLLFTFDVDEPRLGAGGFVRLLVDDHELGGGYIPSTVPFRYSYCETFDVGRDTGSPVSDLYRCPFSFQGQLKRVVVEVLSDLEYPEMARERQQAVHIERSTQ